MNAADNFKKCVCVCVPVRFSLVQTEDIVVGIGQQQLLQIVAQLLRES